MSRPRDRRSARPPRRNEGTRRAPRSRHREARPRATSIRRPERGCRKTNIRDLATLGWFFSPRIREKIPKTSREFGKKTSRDFGNRSPRVPETPTREARRLHRPTDKHTRLEKKRLTTPTPSARLHTHADSRLGRRPPRGGVRRFQFAPAGAEAGRRGRGVAVAARRRRPGRARHHLARAGRVRAVPEGGAAARLQVALRRHRG